MNKVRICREPRLLRENCFFKDLTFGTRKIHTNNNTFFVPFYYSKTTNTIKDLKTCLQECGNRVTIYQQTLAISYDRIMLFTDGLV